MKWNIPPLLLGLLFCLVAAALYFGPVGVYTKKVISTDFSGPSMTEGQQKVVGIAFLGMGIWLLFNSRKKPE